MASSLIKHKRITTTVAKAKALRKYIEPLISKSKEDSTHSRRVVFSYLQDKDAVTELFREISQKIENRPGGYTRILRTGFRIGDAAEMCIIELVDYNDNYTQNKGGKQLKAKATRRGSRTKKKTEDTAHEEENTVTEEIESVEEAQILEETPLEEPQTIEKNSDMEESPEQITETPISEIELENGDHKE
jgi:large subunit ribosomal protein L17